jgi:hypothetical protein
MISKDYVICPFCKRKHSKNKATGTSGLINHIGSECSIICDKCGKEFRCVYEVQIKYKTSKN